MSELSKDQNVCVTMSVEDWATVVAAIGMSPLDLFTKDALNTTIYECVTSGFEPVKAR